MFVQQNIKFYVNKLKHFVIKTTKFPFKKMQQHIQADKIYIAVT